MASRPATGTRPIVQAYVHSALGGPSIYDIRFRRTEGACEPLFALLAAASAATSCAATRRHRPVALT
ncbi:hypothetical protein N9Z54_03165 [Planctomycetota bacterium]|nr:hypothetical protein [Planctomycetota bacterium]